MHPEESFIELRDGRFKIRTLQAGSGDPILYVHGAGGLYWDPLLDALAAGHRVVAPEVRAALHPRQHQQVLNEPVESVRLVGQAGRQLMGRRVGVEAPLEQLGARRRERRPWLPHVTVLRHRSPPRLAPPLPGIGRVAPSEAAAFLSRLHPTGARYEVLESCELGG